MTDHDHYLRGIQAAIEHLEEKRVLFERSAPFIVNKFDIAILELKGLKSAKSAVIDLFQKGGETI